jgi:DNA-binding NarL/FixJ family response regulator
MNRPALLIYQEQLDSLLIIHRLLRMLTESTYALLLAATPEDTLVYAQTHPVTLAVIDYLPPRDGQMDGLDLIRSIKASAPATYIIVTSLYMTPHLAHDIALAGADACLATPFPLDRLEALVTHSLQGTVERQRG